MAPALAAAIAGGLTVQAPGIASGGLSEVLLDLDRHESGLAEAYRAAGHNWRQRAYSDLVAVLLVAGDKWPVVQDGGLRPSAAVNVVGSSCIHESNIGYRLPAVNKNRQARANYFEVA